MKFKKLKNNNYGMTLVELLVAVAIFVAAIVPMLYAFVYSTGYNFRSQQTMQSTGIAEAIIEKCKGANVNSDDIKYALSNPDAARDAVTLQEGIFNDTNFDTSAVSASVSGDDYWIYDVRPIGVSAGEYVDAGNVDRRTYDVLVRFYESPTAQTDYSSIRSMASDTTANFEGLAYTEQLKIADDAAFSYVFDNIKNNVFTAATATCPVALPAGFDASSYYSDSDINTKRILLDRKISINVGDTGVGVKVEYFASYDLNENGTGTDDVFKLPALHPVVNIGGSNYTVDINCEGQLCDVSGNPGDFTYQSYLSGSGDGPIYTAYFDGTVPVDPNQFAGNNVSPNVVSSVFFYYYPGYLSAQLGSGFPSYRDHFYINNSLSATANDHDGHPEKGLSVYLFKQYDSTVFNHGLGESGYGPDVDVKSAGGVNTYLLHNFYYDTDDGTLISGGSFSDSKVTCGTNCFNMSMDEPSVTNYSGGIRDSNNYSLNLSNKAVLPYLHLNEGPVGHIVDMFDSRYIVEVHVFPSGRNNVSSGINPPFDGDEVEIMQAEVVNW